MRSRKAGRGRLSSIDTLPESCDAAIAWAAEQLAARDRTLTDIYADWHEQLAAVKAETDEDFAIPSFSAFHRYSVTLAKITRELKETREIAAAVSEQLGPEQTDDITVMLVQMIKSAIQSILATGDVSTKGVMELSRALQSAIAAQKSSADARQRRQAEITEQLDKAAEAAADGITARAPHMNKSDVLALIRAAYTGGAA